MTTILKGNTYRLTFLTSRLVRLEYQPDGLFEDWLTTCARCRDFEPVELITRHTSRGLEIDTEHLHLVYNEGPFSGSGLCISLKGAGQAFGGVWHYGQKLRTLGGTAAPWTRPMGKFPWRTGLFPGRAIPCWTTASPCC